MALADLAPRPPVIPVFSTTLSDGSAPVFDGPYWAANLRQPVRFHQAVAAAAQQHGTFIEISPHPMLTHAIDESLAETHHHSIPTLVRDTDETLTFHTNFNASHTTHPPKTEHPAEPHPVLPGTPWHHGRHWLTTSATPVDDGAHPFLGWGVTDPTNGARIWEGRLSPGLLWLGDHRVDEACVLPGAVYAELALAAADEAFGTDGESWTIRELSLDQVMHVTDNTVVVTTLTGNEGDTRIEIRSRIADSGWTTHATAKLARGPVSTPRVTDGGAAAADLDPETLYSRLRGAGQNHGPAFRGIVGLTVTETGAARADVKLPSEAKSGAAKFVLHPVMVDIALQALGATRRGRGSGVRDPDVPVVALPVRLAGVRAYGDVTEGVSAVAILTPTVSPDRLTGQVALMSASGEVLLEIDEVEMAVLGGGARRRLHPSVVRTGLGTGQSTDRRELGWRGPGGRRVRRRRSADGRSPIPARRPGRRTANGCPRATNPRGAPRSCGPMCHGTASYLLCDPADPDGWAIPRDPTRSGTATHTPDR